MDKKKISKKQRKYSLKISNKPKTLRLRKNAKVRKSNPEKYLTKEFIGAAIMECFLNNDPEGIIELLEIYLDEHNKSEFMRQAEVPRSTTYQFFRHKNPTIKTLAKIVSTVGEK